LDTSSSSVAVLLTVYRRGEHFRRQVESVRLQSIQPSGIFVWQNGTYFDVADDLKEQLIFASCNLNLGVWARLAYALNIQSDYICMLDDDTIPGRRWIENCLATMHTHEGLLGSRGLRFKSRKSYFHHEEFGWSSPNDVVEQVDIVGHSWFFRREWLTAFWCEAPSRGSDKTVGEDIHFSYSLQRHLGLNTYVPAHPIGHEELWGSQPETAASLGTSASGVSMQPGAAEKFQRVFLEYMKRDFRLCTEPRAGDELLVLGSNVIRSRAVTWVTRKVPRLGKIKRSVRKLLGWS